MSHELNIPSVALLALLVAAIGIGAALFSLNDGDATPAAGTDRASGSQAPERISAVEPALRSGFSIFRTPAEGVPPNVERMFASSQPTTNVDLAQRADVPDAPGPVWVIPGRDEVCLFVERPGGGASSCTTAAKALTDGLDLQLAEGDEEGPLTVKADIRLASDRNLDSAAGTAGEEARKATAVDNVYVASPDRES